MNGMVANLRRVNKKDGEVTKTERMIVDVASVDCGVTELDFEIDGKHYSLQFTLSDLVHEATAYVS